MLQVTITVKGARETRNKMRRLGRDLHDMKRAMKQIGQDVSSYYSNEAFNSRGGVFQARWQPLSAKYQARKLKKWGAKPILEASGAMRDAFTHEATSTGVAITNESRQFKYHQSTAPRTKIPRRQMMGINRPIVNIVKRAIEEDIRRKLRTA